MNPGPNALQKLIVRLYLMPAFTNLWPKVQRPLDEAILKLSGGRTTLTQVLSGVAVVELTSTGAKSGQPRSLPLVGIFDGPRLALIASNFGQKHNPAWYHNLKAHPECTVRFQERTWRCTARQAEGEEREKYWNMAVSVYSGYESYRRRTAPRVIPVMLLDPLPTRLQAGTAQIIVNLGDS